MPPPGMEPSRTDERRRRIRGRALSMAASDLIGALAGLLLVIAPLKDQRARWKVRRNAGAAARAPDNRKPLRTLVAEAWEAHRNAYDPLDAWTQLAGALGILLAFGIKLLGG